MQDPEGGPGLSQSGSEIPEGKGARVTIKFNDLRKGVKELDLTDEEADRLGGRSAKRRGRKPKSASAEAVAEAGAAAPVS